MRFCITRLNGKLVATLLRAVGTDGGEVTINGICIPNVDDMTIEHIERIEASEECDEIEESVEIILFWNGQIAASFSFNPEIEVCEMSYEGNYTDPHKNPFWLIEVSGINEYAAREKSFLDSRISMMERYLNR